MPKPSLGLVKTNVQLDPSVIAAFKWLATSRNTTFSELIRIAAKEFVLKEIRLEKENTELLSSIPIAEDQRSA